jgi:hypothetical protein
MNVPIIVTQPQPIIKMIVALVITPEPMTTDGVVDGCTDIVMEMTVTTEFVDVTDDLVAIAQQAGK